MTEEEFWLFLLKEAKNQALAYEKDMMTDRDIRNGLAYAEEKGRQEEKLAIARAMKLKGYPVEDISQISSLPLEQVQDL